MCCSRTLVTCGAVETWSAVTWSRHRVAELVSLWALADLVTVLSKCSWETRWWREGGRGSHVQLVRFVAFWCIVNASFHVFYYCNEWVYKTDWASSFPNRPKSSRRQKLLLQDLLCSQPFPVNPGRQPQSPETWWQDMPWAQLQRCMQPAPYIPGKHAEREQSENYEMFLAIQHSPLSLILLVDVDPSVIS